MEAFDADIVVVGLGAMGSATLYQLARQGVNVIGVDRFSPPHELGSSHGETRITRQAIGEGAAYVPFVQASHRIWRELEAESGERLFEACGTLVIASPGAKRHAIDAPDFFETTTACARRFGIEHECLSREQVRERFPAFAGMGDDEAAYFEPGGGFVHPERCIRVQLEQAQRHGARVLTERRVVGLKDEEDGVRIALEGEPDLRARRVVVASGAWAGELLGAPLAPLLTVRRQVLHWFRLASPSTYPADTPVGIWLHGEGESDYFYAFPPMPGSETVKVATAQYRTATRADDLERRVAPDESAAMHREHIEGRLPGIGTEVADAKACLYTLTPDQGFIIDTPPGRPRVLAISACSGHGFKHSAGIGQAVAEHLIGVESEFDLTPFRLGRFEETAGGSLTAP